MADNIVFIVTIATSLMLILLLFYMQRLLRTSIVDIWETESIETPIVLAIGLVVLAIILSFMNIGIVSSPIPISMNCHGTVNTPSVFDLYRTLEEGQGQRCPGLDSYRQCDHIPTCVCYDERHFHWSSTMVHPCLNLCYPGILLGKGGGDDECRIPGLSVSKHRNARGGRPREHSKVHIFWRLVAYSWWKWLDGFCFPCWSVLDCAIVGCSRRAHGDQEKARIPNSDLQRQLADDSFDTIRKIFVPTRD